MANTRLSDLSAGGAFADTDLLYTVESAGVGGVQKTGAQLLEYAIDEVGAVLTDTATIDFIYDDGANTITADVKDGSIDNVKIDNTDDFSVNTIAVAGTPTNAGQLGYDSDYGALTAKNGEADILLQLGFENWVRVRNTTGSTISNGEVVYAPGAEGSGEERLLIALADASAENTSRVLGVATHDIENNSYGYITQFGDINDIDTSGFTEGAGVYLSDTTPGALTETPPSSPSSSVFIGYIARTDAVNGRLFVTTIGNTSGDVLAGDATSLIKQARKGSAGTINKGQAVYISGYNVGQQVIEVELAANGSSTTMPAIGIADDTITNSQTGDVVGFGEIAGVDTSSFAVRDPLYVGSTAGTLVNTKPTGTALIQLIGRVNRSNASNGVINVVGAGRSNDVPNFTAADKFWYGGSGGTTTEADITAAGRSLVAMGNMAENTVKGRADGAGSGVPQDLTATQLAAILDNATWPTGTFTPTFGFATTGDLSVSYSAQDGNYIRIGDTIMFWYNMVFTPTFTTASGNAEFRGLPFNIHSTLVRNIAVNNVNSSFSWNSGRTQLVPLMSSGSSVILIGQLGTAANRVNFTAANLTSGASHSIQIIGTYKVA